MKWLRGGARFVLVSVGIIVITAIGVDATQYMSGSQSALGILATQFVDSEGCPKDMVLIELGSGNFCIDKYEVSPGDSCPQERPVTALMTKENIESSECSAQSAAELMPWTSVTYLQAKELCAKRKMRLPNNEEWFEAALGTSEALGTCNLSGELKKAGDFSECVSLRGSVDMIGNAWEWIDGEVSNGTYQNRQLPSDGYIEGVDTNGVAITTTSTPVALMNDDYFWHEADGVKAMMRGGFYGSGKDGGVYSLYIKSEPTFSSAAIGFRCVTDV